MITHRHFKTDDDVRDGRILTAFATPEQKRAMAGNEVHRSFLACREGGTPFAVGTLKTSHRLIVNYCAPGHSEEFMTWIREVEIGLKAAQTEVLLLALPPELAAQMSGELQAAGYKQHSPDTFGKELNTPVDSVPVAERGTHGPQ